MCNYLTHAASHDLSHLGINTIEHEKKLNGKQYFITFLQRLHNLTPLITSQFQNSIHQKTHSQVTISEIKDTPSFIVGIFIRDSPLHINIVHETILGHSEIQAKRAQILKGGRAASDKDVLFLEDKSGRIELDVTECKEVLDLVSGMVVGMTGALNTDGNFLVSNIIFVHDKLLRQSGGVMRTKELESPMKMLFASGLALNYNVKDQTDEINYFEKVKFVNLTLLIEKALNLCGKNDHLEIFLIGPIIDPCVIAELETVTLSELKEVKKNMAEKLKWNFSLLDNFIYKYLKKISENILTIEKLSFHVIPESTDPTDRNYPLSPIPSFFFPLSSQYKNTFNLCSSPFVFEKKFSEKEVCFRGIISTGKECEDCFVNSLCGNYSNSVFNIVRSGLIIPSAPIYTPAQVCIDCENENYYGTLPDMRVFGNCGSIMGKEDIGNDLIEYGGGEENKKVLVIVNGRGSKEVKGEMVCVDQNGVISKINISINF